MEKVIVNLSSLEDRYSFSSNVVFRSDGGALNIADYRNSMKASVGVENVTGIIVEHDAPFTDFTLLGVFKNLKTLLWRGRDLSSLDGSCELKALKRLTFLIEKRKVIDFSFLKNNDYESIDVNDLKLEEALCLGEARSINSLTLRDCNLVDFSFLKHCAIENLHFSKYKKSIISSISGGSIKRLEFYYCANLIEMSSDCSIELDFFGVQACNKFDLNKLAGSIISKNIRISSCKKSASLHDLCSIRSLESLSLVNCNVVLDLNKMLTLNSELKSVLITPIGVGDLNELQHDFPRVAWKKV